MYSFFLIFMFKLHSDNLSINENGDDGMMMMMMMMMMESR